MSMLFLDDDKHRIKRFKAAAGLPVKIATTAAECISLIEEMEEVDILFLDHDLGNEIYVDSGRVDCGMEVVRWITENEPIIRNIIVHSINTPAAMDMVSTLQQARYNAHYIPFSVLLERIGGMI